MAWPQYELIATDVDGDKQTVEQTIRYYKVLIKEQCGGNKAMRVQMVADWKVISK